MHDFRDGPAPIRGPGVVGNACNDVVRGLCARETDEAARARF